MLKFQRVVANNPILEVFLLDSAVTTGAGLASVAYNTTGLVIGMRRELDAAYTLYVGDSGTHSVENITTIGTYAAPTAAHCRWKAVDGTNDIGSYQIMGEQAMFGAADASRYVRYFVRMTGAAPVQGIVPLVAYDPQNARLGMASSLGVLCIGTVNAGGAVGAFTLGTVVEGALVNCGPANTVHVVGVGSRAIKTIDTVTGAITCDNLLANPSGLVAIVYVGAPADALDDLTLTQKASVVTAAGTANTTYDAATGTEIAALDAVVDTVKVDTAAILVDTGTTLDGRIPAALTAGGKIKASLNEVLETALPAESVAGRDAAALGKLLDVATPVLTAASVNQTTDNPTAAAIAAAVWTLADGIETGLTPKNAMRDALAILLGEVAGGATDTPVFKSVDLAGGVVQSTKSRVTGAAVDADGNRGKPVLDHT